VRLTFDPARERHVLLSPETAVVLDASGATVLDLCDGRRTVAENVTELHGRYEHVVHDDVRQFLGRLAARRCVTVHDGEAGELGVLRLHLSGGEPAANDTANDTADLELVPRPHPRDTA
jgi:pyrroloquinoline quinone biosynthesis protein D